MGITNRKLNFLTEVKEILFWDGRTDSNSNGVISISECH